MSKFLNVKVIAVQNLLSVKVIAVAARKAKQLKLCLMPSGKCVCSNVGSWSALVVFVTTITWSLTMIASEQASLSLRDRPSSLSS